VKIAGVQMNVRLADPQANLEAILQRFAETRAAGAALTVFPECVLTGYCFDSLEEARPLSQPVPGPATEQASAACRQLGGYLVFGMLESEGDSVYNAAVLVGAAGVIGSYRKIHLPFLGIDRFTTHGNRPFAVHQTDDLRVGMNICYDGAFPEPSRAMTIQGADLIVLPTNWPPGSECMAAHGINIRAMENAVYYMAVNRVGTERGFRFIGQSRICDPHGQTLAEATADAEDILYAEIDPSQARNKLIVRVPDKHKIHRTADRRPEMYGILTEPHNLTSPGRGD
jgi:predicted amidohydrolase